jgi:PTH1 family peptidyl-tRNA hydrolase
MSLFVKKTNTGTSSPLYTLSAAKTILLVGLGNKGKEYRGTRHNIGFEIVDAFTKQQDFPGWQDKKDLKCHLTSHTLGETRVIVIKPITYMNKSGEAVRAVQHYYKLNNKQTIVVHDELDIAFGQIRTRIGGSSAGNNGLKSIIEHCSEDFARVRIGIKNDLLEKMDSADFVLAKFNKKEQDKLPAMHREAISILTEYIYKNELAIETRSFLA